MANSKWTGISAFLFGTGLGLAVGLLLAPKAGEELREDLADQLEQGTRRVRAASKTMRRRAREIAEQVQQNASDAAEAAVRAASRKLSL
jgi:gas vesicle protein